MKNTWIRKISIILAIALIIQSAMGLKLFSITVKAGDKSVEEQTAGVEFIADDGVPGEEETSETETTGEGDTEESTTEELLSLQQNHRPQKSLPHQIMRLLMRYIK